MQKNNLFTKKILKRYTPKDAWAFAKRHIKLFIYKYPTLFLREKRIGYLKINYRAYSNDRTVLQEVFLKDLYRLGGQNYIRKNDTIIDIGAQIGVLSCYCASKATKGHVFSYEPYGSSYNLLCINIQNNRLKNVHQFNLGVSSKQESIRLYLSENSGGQSIVKCSDTYVNMNCISLKSVFDENNIGCCNLLKVDCEGSEYKILLSTPKAYLKRIERMVIEYHEFPELKYKGQDLALFLRNLDFSVENKRLNNQTGLLYVRNKKWKNRSKN